MQYSAVFLAALAAVASAQDLSSFPACSQQCITDAISSGTSCAATDYACVCANVGALTGAATPCVLDKCGVDVATGQVLPAVQAFCASVGTSSAASSAAPATISTSTSTAEDVTTSTSTSTDNSSPAASTSISVTVTTSSSSATAVVTTTTSAAGGNGTVTTPTPSSVVTAGAATLGSMGAAAVLMVAAFAL